MRILITGVSGFVGSALVAKLLARGEDELFGISRSRPRAVAEGHGRATLVWRSIDVRDRDAVAAFVARVRPEGVFHLAALAHPADCERDPEGARAVQGGGSAALFDALADGTRVVLASSAQVYGTPQRSPIAEDAALAPRTAYGRAKLMAEEIARAAAERGKEVVIARPFNHSGAGQSARYVLPALARSLRAALQGGTPVTTGNLFPRRDFLHVDDVLAAYELLLREGTPGSAYNVCRGEGVSIGEALDELQRIAGSNVPTRTDPALVRDGDPAEIVGDPGRLAALGWRPRKSTRDLLREVWNASGTLGGPLEPR